MSHGEEVQMKGRTEGVDLCSQATKLLSVRPPRFEGEEAAKNDTHLPVAVTQFLDKHLDGKGKPPRRSESEASNNPPAPSTSQKSTVWDQTEEYFRPLTLSDLENLFPKLSVDSTALDSCLFIPPVGTPARYFSADAGLVSVPVSLSSVPAEELVKNSVDTNKDAMDIDEVGTTQPLSKPSQQQEEEEDDDVSSLHWMLGSQERFTLTSERPNKKHKLLGQEAGLERVLLLPRSDDQPGTSASCDVCCTGETNPKSNRLLQCNACKIFVHQKCYGVSAHDTPVNQPWLCTECRTKDGKSKACILCPKEGRVLKPVGNGTGLFAHLFCSLWAPEVYVRDVKLMEPVMNMESVNSMRKKLVCNVCKVKHGACVRCSHGTCRTSFHPICAREAKHQMEIWAKSKTDNVELRAFCSKHSSIQEAPPEPKVNPPEPKVNPPPPQEGQNVIVRKVPLLRFTRKNKTGSKGTVASNPDKSVSKDNNSVIKEQGKDADVDSGNLTPNSPDFALRLKKMIDGGKISVVDLASEVGISSESLEAALVGETTMFSSGLKMKIIKWIQKQNKRADKADPASADVESPVVKSQPPRQRTKSLMVLQDDKQDKQDSDSKPAEDIAATPVTETAKGEDQDRAVDIKVEELPQPAEKPTEKVENESSETQQNVDVADGVVSMDHDLCKDDDNANVTSRSSENGFCNNFVPSGEGSTSTSSVHPIIRRKLMDLKDPNSKQQKSEQALSDVPDSVEGQLSKARSLGLLDMAPQDELEGELIYLQSKLLDNQLDVKHRCEELLEKVVHEIPKESESVSRRKWDLVVVSHFLRDVREVKKRGRKERKHREAQAVMAEATAAVSASVRRKDTKDDNQQQQQPTSSNKDKELKSRTKDSTRSKASSSDKNAGNQFQIPILSRDNTLCCDVCLRSETVLNRIFVCSVCKTMVHLDCYRSVWNPAGPWKCELCEEMSESLTGTSSSELGEKKVGFGVKCALCGNSRGAFRKTSEGLWVHAFCAEWLLESVFRRGQGDLVHGLDTLLMDKDTCCICFSKIGSCLKCSYGECLVTFHPWCGRAAGFYMNARGLGGFLQHKAYCAQHTTDQKLADDQQYGPEEIKCLKQTRVELEKLRLLCERIIKREKLKRDLVQCSNQILGKRKDCIVSTGSESHVLSRSGHTRSGSHIPPGSHMSSESATTSINNRSSYNSRTVQQSPDDVTIDSSVSRGRNTVRFSLNPNRERETMDDSSTSPQGSSFKRKMVDRGPFAGKTVPQRGGAVPPPNPTSNPSKPSSQTSADDGDRKSKQGQLVMTSDQATAQNQRLPKGFAYVPIGSLAKDKPRDNSTAGPRDSEEPGG